MPFPLDSTISLKPSTDEDITRNKHPKKSGTDGFDDIFMGRSERIETLCKPGRMQPCRPWRSLYPTKALLIPTQVYSGRREWQRFDNPNRKRAAHSYRAGYRPEDHDRLQQLMKELMSDVNLSKKGKNLADILNAYNSSIANATETLILFDQG
jgi:hypothetical protein